MTIGAASLLVPPVGAGVAAAALVHDRDVSTQARPVAGASVSAAPELPSGPPHGVRAPNASTGLGVQSPGATEPRSTARPRRTVRQPPARDAVEARTDNSRPPKSRSTPSPSPSATAGTRPIVRQVTEVREIPYRTRLIRDRSLAPGEYQLRTPGRTGIRTLRYEVTTVDGRQTGKRFVGSTVTRQAVTRVIAVGGRTKPGGPGCVPDDGYGCD
jgi:hypothetical protein